MEQISGRTEYRRFGGVCLSITGCSQPHLIVIGEDMVNATYSSPVDFPPKEQIEEVEARLFKVAETGKCRAAASRSPSATAAATAHHG